jgi:hypothetical protein
MPVQAVETANMETRLSGTVGDDGSTKSVAFSAPTENKYFSLIHPPARLRLLRLKKALSRPAKCAIQPMNQKGYEPHLSRQGDCR